MTYHAKKPRESALAAFTTRGSRWCRMIALVFLLLCLALAQAFRGLPGTARTGVALGLFGGGKKTAVIKVDGKTIEASATPCNLRKELQANGIEVYPLKARITGNCGGAGICGTCAVKVLDGMANLNAPSKNEQNTLRDKPADYRLSCCARVSGPITIKTKP